MPNATLSDALKEAYATAPTDKAILHTIELRHDEFKDSNGNPVALRVVRDHADLTATLEADAPLNGGQSVTFTAFPFDFSLPAIKENEQARLSLSIDNVGGTVVDYSGRTLMDHIEQAIAAPSPIKVIYRPYLSDDLSGPYMDPPIEMTLTKVTVTPLRITGSATFVDLLNRSFPSEMYTRDKFPALVQ